MSDRQRNSASIILGLATIGYVVFLYFSNPSISANTIDWVLFAILITITTIFGIPLGVGEVSLVPMISISATLIIGVVPTVVANIFADLLYGLIRSLIPGKTRWVPEENGFSLAATTTANITMHVFGLLASGSVYYGFGGTIPVQTFSDFSILVGMGAAYISINYIYAGFFLLMRGQAYTQYLWKQLKQILYYEATPIVFSPFLALVLIKLGKLPFIMVAVGLILIANLLRDQARTHKDLERRIKEMSSLQAVGQTLSSSLDTNEVSETIYREVSKLMPVNNFYIALWNDETNEVSFPVSYEHNQKVTWSPRRAKNGPTEYVIRNQVPLLIETNVKATVESLGLEHYGQEAKSWLGVPILAGAQAIGMIAVQSYTEPDQIHKPLDHNHQEILSTIAAQASVAIQNAWLYTQTDKALTQRVQELNSILTTTSDGIMLLDTEFKVVEVNKAFCKMMNINPGVLLTKSVPRDLDDPFSSLHVNEAIIEGLSNQPSKVHQDTVTLYGLEEIPAERKVSAVLDKSGKINGWLCVFRDLTEEKRLETLKEDLTRMLVHDLRSPIVTIQSGLDMIEMMIEDNDPKTLLEMLDISRKGSTRILDMINELLNVTKLEAGELVLQLETINLPKVAKEISNQFQPVLQQGSLSLVYNFQSPFPTIQGDLELLRRVIHNILDNAIKFTPDGKQIEFWGQVDSEQPESILIGVQDQGPGIKREELPLLFQKYFTSQREKSRRRGTGLGLYFCKLAVEAHHGKIWAESEFSQGSNFIIRLPVHPNSTE